MTKNNQIWIDWQKYIFDNFQVKLTAQKLEKFKQYAQLLIEWNNKINLVSNSSLDEIIWRHFTDSVASIKVINDYTQNINIIDVGTGAGFPGIPIKFILDSANLRLVESIEKKCSFLNEVKNSFGLSSAEVVNDRAENIGINNKYRSQNDIAVSRAVSQLNINLEYLLPLLKIGGSALIYKTANYKEELEESYNALKELGGSFSNNYTYSLPNKDIKFAILVFKKISKTPDKYPRKSGIPKKRPL